MLPLRPGDPPRIAGFELLGRIGAGGMGVVYLGRRARDGAEAAVKVVRDDLSADPRIRARFAREAAAVTRVHGPHVACQSRRPRPTCRDRGRGGMAALRGSRRWPCWSSSPPAVPRSWRYSRVPGPDRPARRTPARTRSGARFEHVTGGAGPYTLNWQAGDGFGGTVTGIRL